MKIGLMGAMPEEVELLRQEFKETHRETVGQRDFLIGTYQGREAVLVFSRMGKVASASTATTLIDRYGADLIVFTGLAGGAAPELNIGDVVVGDELVQHDMDVSPLPIFKRFEIPLLGKTHFNVEPRLVELAKSSSEHYLQREMRGEIRADTLKKFGIHEPKVAAGLIASGDQFVADSGYLAELRGLLPRLQCVEMEGAAVAQVCYEHGCACVVLRSISDKADHSAHIDFPAFVAEVGAHFSAGVVRGLVRAL